MTRMPMLALALATCVTLTPAAGQESRELTNEEELRLAMSAGPLSVSQDADVYRMTERGFERVVIGTNGWACLVVRSATDPMLLAPHCLNPPAVATVLPAMLCEGQLQAKGMDAEAIDLELRRQFAANELPLPEGPAYAYMLSAGQQLGRAGQFKPHFMLYIPYVTNEDIGGNPSQMAFPFVGPVENHPLSTVVIIMEEFVEPASVALPNP